MDVNNNSNNINSAIYYNNATTVPIQTNELPNHMVNFVPQPIAYGNAQQNDHEQTLFPFMYGHDKWPHKVEKAFTDALRLIMKSGTSKIKVRNKNYGRNELISLYIRYETGEIRTKKQISSHIQVWKKSILSKASSNMRLTQLDGEILSLIEKGAEQTKESLERFYGTFEVIIDTLSKEETMSGYHPNSYPGANPPITKVYPQQYAVESPYGANYKNITPTVVEPPMGDSNLHRLPGYQYQPSYNAYPQQQPILMQQVHHRGYHPVDTYQMPHNDPNMHYNVTHNNAVGYQRVYPDHHNQSTLPSNDRLMHPNDDPNQLPAGHRNWVPLGQQIQTGTKDSSSRVPPINYPPQYINNHTFTTGQAPTNHGLAELEQSNTGSFSQVKPVMTDTYRVKLRPPIQNSSLIENRYPKSGVIYSENNQPSNYVTPINQDFKSQPSIITIQPIGPANETNNTSVGNVDSRYAINTSQGEHAASTNATDTLSYADGRATQNSPFIYKNSPVQQGSPNVAPIQPLVMLPSYPYYSKGNNAPMVKNEGTGKSLPSINPK